ncbi:MAG TPA: hypothetical protein VKR52_00450 [Terracidiphilus sp.]|nr:hypothetical protein [Terracidiphilus sp.]
MKKSGFLLVAVCLASTLYAKEPKHYQTGTLLRMDSVPCGTAEKDAKSFTGELLGTDSGSKKSEQVLCQEYVLQADTLVYRLRPRDEKHPVLLPIGEHAQFRLNKDKVALRVEDLDDKEREYTVVSIAPRTDNAAAATEVTSANRVSLSPQNQK